MIILSLSEQQLEAICNVLGDTVEGLTGSEIGTLLAQCRIEDLQPGGTKRYRLYNALSVRQRQDRCANNIIAFIQAAMTPARFAGNRERFNTLKQQLNQALVFAGYMLGEDGHLCQVTPATTLDEAEGRTGRLQAELRRREVHPDVLRFCQVEFLQENYFHAVLEATKSVADKIRRMTGLTSDGAPLIDQAFGLGSTSIPLLAFNSLQTDTERSEHTGLMNLIKGLFGAFRNPTAHDPKISWPVNEQDAIDLLTLVSLIHRRLDQAVRTR
ncbi:MAG: TIGR02391 family protein [Thermoflexales bacterium]|nr:TIGR02391 family protein [Thermoflexales bacterium]